ncbi:phage tail protein [Cyanobacteria bacterium FACHB-63]|nr:phage tail protein [Cyanobacteria bacterium FACHB-63]
MVRTYPPVGFFFEVSFQGQYKQTNLSQEPVETRFQSVSGLNVELQTETLKEGGEQRFEHILPVRAKYNPLLLKRGLVKDSKMIQWCMDAIENFDIQPMDLLVHLLHIKPSGGQQPQKGEPLVSWSVVNAWPKKWSVSDFNAEQNSIAIESLELNYSYFRIKT